MLALLKILVLIAIFLLASHANAFTSLSPVAGNQVQVKQWFQFVEPMSKLTNKPNGEPIKKSWVANRETKQDAELPCKLTDLTNTQMRGLCHGKKAEPESLADQPTINEEIDHSIAASDSSKNQWQMPTPINLDFSRLSHATTMTNQEAHLHSTSPWSFSSARKLFSTICSFQYGLSSSMVWSLAVKVQVSSKLTVSRYAFTLLTFEPVTSTTKVSRHAFTLLSFEPVTSTTKVSCHAFALSAFELVTLTTNISSAKSALKALAEMQPSADISQNLGSQHIFQLIDASISNKDEMCSASQLAVNEHKGLIKSIMPFIFQLIVGSKQVHQRILKQVLVDVWSSNAISYFGPN